MMRRQRISSYVEAGSLHIMGRGAPPGVAGCFIATRLAAHEARSTNQPQSNPPFERTKGQHVHPRSQGQHPTSLGNQCSDSAQFEKRIVRNDAQAAHMIVYRGWVVTQALCTVQVVHDAQ